MHVHIYAPEGEAKFWLEPVVALAEYHGLTDRSIRQLKQIVEDRKDEIARAWKIHFER